MKFLFKYMRGMGWYISLTLTVKVLATVLELFIPYVLGHILDNVVPTHSVRRSGSVFTTSEILCADAVPLEE